MNKMPKDKEEKIVNLFNRIMEAIADNGVVDIVCQHPDGRNYIEFNDGSYVCANIMGVGNAQQIIDSDYHDPRKKEKQ